MNLARLRDFTTARVALGRAGVSLPTSELLDFQLAHARARDAVHAQLDAPLLALEMRGQGLDPLIVNSAAPDRGVYLRRPHLGRTLAPDSQTALAAQAGLFDAVFVFADGLSALALQRHALPLFNALLPKLDPADWRLAPPVIAVQARVALGDPIAQLIAASLAVVLIGERPGLSSPDSLGVYLTWRPQSGTTDADRNCISNIRPEGLSYSAAAHKLHFLMTQARARQLSGVSLKEMAQIEA